MILVQHLSNFSKLITGRHLVAHRRFILADLRVIKKFCKMYIENDVVQVNDILQIFSSKVWKHCRGFVVVVTAFISL